MKEQVSVSIGIPVYNGERFLAQTLDSILSQTYQDFEIIISDNASDDNTEAICRNYAAIDSRIRYYRNETNLGAAYNYNCLVELAKGKYFKWAAHDDLLAPTFIERCVEILEANSDYVLVYPLSSIIDEEGKPVRQLQSIPGLDADRPYKRFRSHAGQRGVHQNMVFGVVRTDILRQTRLIGAYSSSDRILNAELALYGPFYEIPEVLFFKRNHPDAHWKVHDTRQSRDAWYDPRLSGKKSYPMFRLMREHFHSIKRAPLDSRERVLCQFSMLWWLRLNWRRLLLNQ